MRKTADKLPMESKLKVAIIGAGKMGVQHIKAIHQIGLGEIVGIVDPYVDKEMIFNILNKNPQYYSDIEEFLDENKADVVHICTPPKSHFKIAEKVLLNGLHVYVEKPFTLRFEEALSLFEIAERNSLKICAGHQILFQNAASKASKMLELIQDVIYVESFFSFHQVNKNISRVEQTLDILPHPVYLLLNFMEDNSPYYDDFEIKSIDVKANGDIFVTIKHNNIIGNLIVTLTGRPVDNYIKIIGSNGTIYADFTLGFVRKHLGPGTSTIYLAAKPFSEALQIMKGSLSAIKNRLTKKQLSYHGLAELIEKFYLSIIKKNESPISKNSILNTVKLCETIGNKLTQAEDKEEKIAYEYLKSEELRLVSKLRESEVVLVTGGTGFLGRKIVKKLLEKRHRVRVTTRRLLSNRDKIPGVEYVVVDLSKTIPGEVFNNVRSIVHCAAETSGGKLEHKINTIEATRNLLQEAAKFKVKNIIYISSLAVLNLKSSGKIITESTAIDLSESRGPYVWGKANAEKIATELGIQLGLDVKIIRPGSLIDFNEFSPPGRLGRTIGNIFVAIGSKNETLELCDVDFAAKIISAYIEAPENKPNILNLIVPNPPTRGQLIKTLRENRPYLKIIRLPMFVLTLLNPFLWIVQKILRPKAKPLNIKSAFTGYKIDKTLLKSVVSQIN